MFLEYAIACAVISSVCSERLCCELRQRTALQLDWFRQQVLTEGADV